MSIKPLVVIILVLVATVPCFADVTGSYIENTPSEISYLQLAQTGSVIDGSVQIISSSSNRTGYAITNANLSGSAHASSLFVRVDNGWLGKSNLFSGNIDGSALTIDFPQADGRVSNTHFQKASSSTWNRLVVSFEARMSCQAELRALFADRQNAGTTYTQLAATIKTDFPSLQAAVTDFNLAHVNEAKAENVLDQANAAYNDAKSAYDHDTAANTNEAQTQTDATALQTATTSLSAATTNLWRASDCVWADVTKISTLHNTIATDGVSIRNELVQFLSDSKEIVQLDSVLKITAPSDIRKVPSVTVLDRFLTQLNVQLTALIPKPSDPPTSQTGEVDVDSAAVRNYSPYNANVHEDVRILFTVGRGKRLHQIKGQTCNDYIVGLTDGSLGLISKSDVKLVTDDSNGGSAANIVGRLGVVTAHSAQIRSGLDSGAKVLSVCLKGQNVAIIGQSDTQYAVLMVDQSTGFINKVDVQLLDSQVISNKYSGIQ